MSPNPKRRDSAEILEDIKGEILARVYEFILSYPMPSREPKEAVTESPGDSAENRDSSPNKPEKNRAGSGKSRDSSPLREEAPSAESAREPGGES